MTLLVAISFPWQVSGPSSTYYLPHPARLIHDFLDWVHLSPTYPQYGVAGRLKLAAYSNGGGLLAAS
jgi:hypothetical protein